MARLSGFLRAARMCVCHSLCSAGRTFARERRWLMASKIAVESGSSR